MNIQAIVAAFMVVAVAESAQARLGETVQEIDRRYGTNGIEGEMLGLKGKAYRFRQFTVQVFFKDGRSVMEWLHCTNRTDELPDETCLALAESISGGTGWKAEEDAPMFARRWAAPGYRAVKSFAPLEPQTLLVTTLDQVVAVRRDATSKLEDIVNAFGGPAPKVDEGTARILARARAAEAARLAREVAQENANRERAKAQSESNYVRWLLVQATNGSAWAQHEVGIRYRDGRGIAQDESLSRAWLKKAAKDPQFLEPSSTPTVPK